MTSRRLADFTIQAFAAWVHEPLDEEEGQRRALIAAEFAREHGSLDLLLKEVSERSAS